MSRRAEDESAHARDVHGSADAGARRYSGMVLPLPAGTAYHWSAAEQIVIAADGRATVTNRDRADEILARFDRLLDVVERDLVGPLEALKSIAADLSARGGSVATRMINVQVERIAEVLTSGVAQPRGMGPRSGLLTKREAAQLCGVSLRTFERRVMGDLVPTRVGRRVLYAAEEVERWLDEQKAGSSSGILGRRSWR